MDESLRTSLEDVLDTRLSDARSSYSKIIDRLWVGNAGGATVALNALEKHVSLVNALPFFIFIFGVMILTVGALFEIKYTNKNISEIEKVIADGGNIIHLNCDKFPNPSDSVSPTIFHLLSCGTFFAGVISGFLCVLIPFYI